jgi:hypothetical protein
MPLLLYQWQHQSLQNSSPHASSFISVATPDNSEQQPTCLLFYISGNTSHFRTAAHMPLLLYQGQHQSLQNSSTHSSTFISQGQHQSLQNSSTHASIFISGATPVTSEQQPTCLNFYIRGNTSHFRTAAHMPPLLYQGQHQSLQNSSPTFLHFYIPGATPVTSEQQPTCLHFYIRGNTSPFRTIAHMRPILCQGQQHLIQNTAA